MTRSAGTARPLPPPWLAWLVWGTAAVFYLDVFFLRAAPAVMTSELMRDFHIGAASLGNLSAFYFYFYAAMQIPIGILTNSWGPRKLLVCGAMLAAGGQFLFGATDHLAVACLGRAIIGGATAVGWLVVLRLAAHWFPSQRFGAITGLGLFFGNLGALFAQVPLRFAVEFAGWRGTIIASAAGIFVLGILAWIVVRDDPSERNLQSYAPADLQKHEKTTFQSVFAGLRNVFSHRNTWLLLIAQGGMVGPIMTFTGLWGPPFLKARFGLAPKEAATICSIMIICWAAACPLFGAWSDKIGKRKAPYLTGSVACAIGWIVLFYANGLPLAAFTAVAAFTSLATGCVIIAFAYGRESVPAQHMGAVTATTNIGNMLGNVLLQPGIGLLLDWKWSGASVNGSRVYSVDAYRAGFVPIVAWGVVACAVIVFTKETGARQGA